MVATAVGPKTPRLRFADRVEITSEGRNVIAGTPESTAPTHGQDEPVTLAFHAINNAAQILVCILAGRPAHVQTLEVHVVDLRRVSHLIVDACSQISQMNEAMERQERLIEEQRVETVREKHYVARVEEKNSELVQGIINLTSELDAAHAIIRQLRETTLAGEIVHTPSAPRLAVSGGR